MDSVVLASAAEVARPPHAPALVFAMQHEADDVVSLALKPLDGPVLPFTAGAHVELHLPGGLRRAYSLVNAPDDRRAYRVAVHRSPTSRGGSRSVHETLRVGQVVQVGRPRNDFALSDDAAPSVLIAGGIGITPLWAMAQALEAQGRPWTLHYAVRERRRAAFVEPLVALGGSRVHLHFDGEADGAPLSLAQVIGSAVADAHLYCCGPAGMLQAFRDAAADRDPARVHFERFASDTAPPPAADGGAFDVVLARSGRTVRVERGVTVLDALEAAGVATASSCREGFCGTCETRVLEGVPEHADSVLSGDERRAGRSMMICCSRSRTDRLVLDL